MKTFWHSALRKHPSYITYKPVRWYSN